MSLEDKQIKNIIEAALLSMAKPMSIEQIMKVFADDERPTIERVRHALKELQNECEERGIELKEVASGFRYQAKQELAPWLARLWEEKPPRYSRAFLETLALIAYRQPVTRAEIEEVRGVSVSSNIIKSMLEREWIRVVGHRDVPGRPALYATTKQFLDYFNMKSLEDLPSLAEIKDLDDLNPELQLPDPDASEEQSDAADKASSEVTESAQASDDEIQLAPIAQSEDAEQHKAQAEQSQEQTNEQLPDNQSDVVAEDADEDTLPEDVVSDATEDKT